MNILFFRSCSCLHISMNFLTNISKSAGDIQITETNHQQSLTFEIFRSFPIIFHFLGGVVLRTIQFYYQSCLMAIKIHDVISNHILSVKSWLIPAQQVVPKKNFLLCHALSQSPCILFEVLISFHVIPFKQVFASTASAGLLPHSTSGPSGRLLPGRRNMAYTPTRGGGSAPLVFRFSQRFRSRRPRHRRRRNCRRSWDRSRPGDLPAGTASQPQGRRPSVPPRWQP